MVKSMQPEITWKEIPVALKYEVSDMGEVRNRETEKVLRQSLSRGYPMVKLQIEGRSSPHKIHKLVLISFVGERPPAKETNHINGIKTDNRLSNLEWVTQSENTKHAYRTGLMVPKAGEESGRAKLNDEQVLKIRHLREHQKLTYVRLGRMFNVCINTVWHIVNRKSWKHI
jgi:hypothetical protein